METKKHIRRQILEIRDGIPQSECSAKSAAIIQKVLADDVYKKAACLLLYLDYNKEVETTKLVEEAWMDGKTVYCPKVVQDDMLFYKLTSFSEMHIGYKGIREPTGRREDVFESTKELLSQTLCIMPGVVFDTQKHRIGYGKGFYDRFLAGKETLMTMALCFEYQLLEIIPSEEFDLKPKILYTELQKL